MTRIQDEKAGGVSIRTVKSFLSKIPSVVSGWCPCCVVKWWSTSLEPRGASVATHHNQQSKGDLSGSFTLRLLQPMVHSHRGNRPRCYIPLVTWKKSFFSPLSVPLPVCRRNYAKVLRVADLTSVPCPAPSRSRQRERPANLRTFSYI